MKKLTLFLFAALLGVLGAYAIEAPSGIVTVGERATALETGRWYCLYNNGVKRYARENNANALKQTATSPLNQEASAALGYFVELIAEGDSYYIRTAQGNYFNAPATTAQGTGSEPVALDITALDGAEGHFTIASGKYKLSAPSTVTDDLKGYGLTAKLNGSADWSFMEVSFTPLSDLSGKELYNYQMGKLGFVRLTCRRGNHGSWLSASPSGSVQCASKSDDMALVWYMQKSGTGYTLRSASNAAYLRFNDGFSTAAEATKFYVRFSPNNKGDEAYINISSLETFGNKCLNLKHDFTSVTTWSSEGDEGCDWAIELAEDVTMAQVAESVNASKRYAKTLTDGRYYRIANANKGNVMTESADGIRGQKNDPDNFSQLWKVGVKGNAVTLQNAFSGKYIQNQGTTSAIYLTDEGKATHYIRSTGDAWEYSWYITNTADAWNGMHCDNGNAVVLWSNDNPNNKWAFVETDVTDEEVEAAQGNYNAFKQLLANATVYQAALDNLFQDKACSVLKADIQALTDEALAANADYAALPAAMQQMVLKVKNNTWQYTTTQSAVTDSYEKFFRIAPYRVYSHYDKMSWREYTGQSNSYGKLSGPTSIVLNSGDIAYIYVDEAPSADCTLEVEIVPTEGVPGNHQVGATTPLHQGFNAVMATEQCLVYIFYQLDDPDKYLADYPDMKIHIEGGTLQGYFDLTRGMKNQDWKNMNELGMMQHSSCPVINLKSNNLVFAMHTQLVKDAIATAHKQAKDEMEDVEFLLRLWNTIPVNQEKYQGLEEFEGRFNNIWNVFSVNYNYMFASTYGTYYNENTLSGIMNYYESSRFNGDGSEGGPMWGPHHEIGHNHQATVCVTGTMESSNNMFSNIGTLEGGICDTRYAAPHYNFDHYLANGAEWNDRPIEYSCRMFTQLYLYFHMAGHHPRFLQELHKALRKDPIIKTQGWVSTTNAEGETVSGYDVKGSQDYLHFAKKCCDVAQADLSEFFESYGFFVPENKHFVGDYANYVVTTTQKEIDEARAYMKQYPKKLGNIMFITDHQVRHKANPDNIYGYVPTRADGMRWQASAGNSAWEKSYYAYGCCNGGDYESYDGHTEYDVTGDYYMLNASGTTISFKGKNYLGHKVYDLGGNLIWAVNKASTTIPEAIRSKFPNEVVIVAAQQNMTDVPCPYYKSGSSPVSKLNVSFPDGTKKEWMANDNIDQYLPTNAVAVVTLDNKHEALLAGRNIVSADGTAQSIVIDGDMPAYIPTDIQAQSVVFTKGGEGTQALCLPFAVTDAKTVTGDAIVDAATVEAGQPVVVQGAVTYTLTDARVAAGSYTSAAEGYILAADGKSVVPATDVAPFTYIWTHAFNVGDGSAITAPTAEAQHTIYNLSGQRLARPQKGLNIVGGKKVIVK